MFTQETDKVVILDIPIRTKQVLSRFVNTNPSAYFATRLIIEWTINQFINARSSLIDSSFIRELHDKFIGATYFPLSQIEKGYYIRSTQWEEDVLTVTISRSHHKRLPAFWRVKDVITELTSDLHFEKQGVSFTYLPESKIGTAETCRKPYHQIQQDEYLLEEGIHLYRGLQEAYDQIPEKLTGIFFSVRDDNDSLDFLLDDLRASIKGRVSQAITAYPTQVIENEESEESLPWNDGKVPKKKSGNPTSFQPTKVNGKIDWKKQSHKLMANGKFYRSPHKCANDLRIDVKQVYGRLYSTEPKWSGWHFIKR